MSLRRLALALTLCALMGCYVPPQESKLAGTFDSHQAEFSQLLEMAHADQAFPRISVGEVPPRGMPDLRFRAYQKLFRDLSIDNGVDWGIPGFPTGFWVLASTSVPVGATGKYLGYVYSLTPLRPVVSHLPISGSPFEVHHDHGYEAYFRPLTAGWYLFYYVAW